MESSALLRSYYCSAGVIANVQCALEKPGVLPMCNLTSNKSSFTQVFNARGARLTSSSKRVLLPCLKASETASSAISEDEVSVGTSESSSKKKSIQGAIFPDGIEALLLEVCDETEVAELKIKVGDFEMNLLRNVGGTPSPTPVASHSPPQHAASKPVESKPPPESPLPSKPSVSPFKNVSLPKLPKLVALEASGADGYVLVLSPMVGSFLRSKTIKGKKLPPIFEEGDMIKEGQVIGYVNQFGSQLPLKSDVSGEVLKLLHNEGDAIGYGDPLIAVLPSFHGIK